MKLVCPFFEEPIEFYENQIQVLIIENKELFRSFILKLVDQIDKKEGMFVLSESYKPIDISKNMIIVNDLFSLEINERKILNKVFSILNNKAINEDNYGNTMKFKNYFLEYIDYISYLFEYPLIYNMDVDLISIFKMAGIQLKDDYESLLEKILDYVSIMNEIFGINCFVFVNLKIVFSNEELNEFYSEIFYKKINVLLLESIELKNKILCEKVRIIDEDLCEIF